MTFVCHQRKICLFSTFLQDTHPNPSPKALSKKKARLCYRRQGLSPCSALLFFLESVLQMHFCRLGKPSLGQPKNLWILLADRYHFISSNICSVDRKSTFS